MALLIPLFVGCFYSKDNTNNHVRNVFQTLARLMGCLLLFFFANVLKTFIAKIMASHFHKEAHFEKMQEALQKVSAAVLCCAMLCHAVLCCVVLLSITSLGTSSGTLSTSGWLHCCQSCTAEEHA